MSRWEQEQAEQAAYEEHMQAMYDEQCRMQQIEEEEEHARLRAEVERLNEALRGERAAVVAYLRQSASVAVEFGGVADALTAEADAIERGEHSADLAPDTTADKAQLAALGAALQGQRGVQGR